MKKITFLCILLISSIAFSQEEEVETSKDTTKTAKINIKPIRLGVKVGFPNVVGGNIEYVTPLLDQRLGVFIDYGNLPEYEFDDSKGGFTHTEFGINYYLKKNKGSGFYIGLSRSSLKIDGEYSDIGTIVEQDQSVEYTGTATGDVKINTTNLKLGVKLGKTVYFRFEAGYGFGDIPEGVEVTGIAEVTPNGGPTQTQTETALYLFEDIEGLNNFIKDSGTPVVNIGIGFSF
ncbi:hypothetical protein [Urechidicola croceus]|uniref:Outer membrane protein beta-barrel domain-containing protein n=1 Tax=Urechidicola croceus TaxID=1850246 RepID=A0A1D8P5Z4_9FLAO|nr:hypothetical protein [Urechidicola croceus]AOW19991.1 hypothetical protein LPB138_04515 [Urechidicola croceus]